MTDKEKLITLLNEWDIEYSHEWYGQKDGNQVHLHGADDGKMSGYYSVLFNFNSDGSFDYIYTYD